MPRLYQLVRVRGPLISYGRCLASAPTSTAAFPALKYSVCLPTTSVTRDIPSASVRAFHTSLIREKIPNRKKKKAKVVEDDDEDSDSEKVEEEEEEEEEEDDGIPKDYKDVTIHVHSPRVDHIIKDGLPMARTKVEQNFYDGKFFINSEKMIKKSQEIYAGDVIDCLQGPSPENPKLNVVTRLEVVKISGNTTTKGKYPLKLKVWKGLLVPDYF